ncbi:proteasome subunit beta type-4 isoform X2 [Lingula anatina]|uniref:Proteasome subunit beta n=1 Tax=Lingula anatina TaxID=7574 RepID=A0A1S3JE44_LINAN|nr:proteasome subunit beta type-4 isoform X2 [Lingula anatina]|eukprot:XP_013408441.1 proteasome subunit beta type-4 isoform X2 [Lingula anatina]
MALPTETDMSLEFWRNGPTPGGLYNFPGQGTSTKMGPIKKTLSPMVTGTSVLGVKFDGGIILAADMLGSYGSLARFMHCPRLMKVNDSTVMGAGGDYADFQYIKSVIEQRVIDEECMNDGFQYTPKSLFSWLTRIMYNRRSRFNPLWNTIVVGGLQDGEPFLGYVDKIGTAFKAPSVCSGYGAYIAQPILRNALEKQPNLTEQQAKELIDQCLTVLHYRDARSLNKYQIAIVTKDGARIEGPISSATNWDIAERVGGYE